MSAIRVAPAARSISRSTSSARVRTTSNRAPQSTAPAPTPPRPDRHFLPPGTGGGRGEGVPDVDLHHKIRQQIQRLDRIAIAMEQHVGRIVVDPDPLPIEIDQETDD